MERATFAFGCFWGTQFIFKKIPGVIKTAVGYAGGHKKNPTYEEVCTGNTGHTEAVDMEFDPATVSYQALLETFFEHHDPTTPNRSGPDVGEQYRSVIFYHNQSQKSQAEEYRDRLTRTGRYRNPIVTEIVPATEFYRAEEYHQDYADKNPSYVCHI